MSIWKQTKVELRSVLMIDLTTSQHILKWYWFVRLWNFINFLYWKEQKINRFLFLLLPIHRCLVVNAFILITIETNFWRSSSVNTVRPEKNRYPPRRFIWFFFLPVPVEYIHMSDPQLHNYQLVAKLGNNSNSFSDVSSSQDQNHKRRKLTNDERLTRK